LRRRLEEARILGDGPALDPDVSLFQRLAARDQDEAIGIVSAYAKQHAPEEVYDGILLPALRHARTAVELAELSESDERFIDETTERIIDELAAQEQAKAGGGAEAFQPVRNRVRIVCCAARDELVSSAWPCSRSFSTPRAGRSRSCP
jgi:hypothetical protein